MSQPRKVNTVGITVIVNVMDSAIYEIELSTRRLLISIRDASDRVRIAGHEDPDGSCGGAGQAG